MSPSETFQTFNIALNDKIKITQESLVPYISCEATRKHSHLETLPCKLVYLFSNKGSIDGQVVKQCITFWTPVPQEHSLSSRGILEYLPLSINNECEPHLNLVKILSVSNMTFFEKRVSF